MTFNVKNSSVSISYFFFVTLCLALVLDKTDTAAMALCAAVVHEAGHLICMLALGERAVAVIVAPFGFAIRRGCSSYRREFYVALAGPLANILLAVALLALGKHSGNGKLFKAAIVNFSLAIFNLLPIEPLDCGRAVRCRLMCRMNSVRAEKTIFILGIIFLVPMCAMGFLVLIKSKYNITLLLASAYLFYTLLKRCE